MSNEDMHGEECAGCGWAFADGGSVHEMIGRDLGRRYEPREILWVCDPCYHTSGLSEMFGPPSKMELNQMTNLILKAIRDASPTPPEETKG